MNRRQFLRCAAGAAITAPVLGTCYTFAESTNLKVVRVSVTVPRLPRGCQGMSAAFLTDLHYGPYLSPEYLAAVVRTTMLLNPDVILFGGDFTLREEKYAAPCFEALAKLSAPLGMYAVLGNHDYRHGLEAIRSGMRSAKIEELTNHGLPLTRNGDRLWLAGVDDFWHGRPDLGKALTGCATTDACVLLCHNPDFVESIRDPRVGLVLSGHTHGGQVSVPGYGSPIVPSRYGQKYARGLVEAPATQVYVSTGIGMSGLPVRANCRPELTFVTLN